MHTSVVLCGLYNSTAPSFVLFMGRLCLPGLRLVGLLQLSVPVVNASAAQLALLRAAALLQSTGHQNRHSACSVAGRWSMLCLPFFCGAYPRHGCAAHALVHAAGSAMQDVMRTHAKHESGMLLSIACLAGATARCVLPGTAYQSIHSPVVGVLQYLHTH
jgi:hypothetical protein